MDNFWQKVDSNLDIKKKIRNTDRIDRRRMLRDKNPFENRWYIQWDRRDGISRSSMVSLPWNIHERIKPPRILHDAFENVCAAIHEKLTERCMEHQEKSKPRRIPMLHEETRGPRINDRVMKRKVKSGGDISHSWFPTPPQPRSISPLNPFHW